MVRVEGARLLGAKQSFWQVVALGSLAFIVLLLTMPGVRWRGGKGIASTHSAQAKDAMALLSHEVSSSPTNSAAISQRALDAIVQHYQQEQEQFCKELAEGVPNPGGTLGNESYFRKADIPAQQDAAVNFSMYVLKEEDIVSNSIKSEAIWESTETAGIMDRLKEWRDMHIMNTSEVVLVDIGANVGWFSVNAAVLGYTVLAFEPMAKNIGAIRRTLCDNPQMQKRLTLITKGLSHKPGKCKLFVVQHNRGNGVTVCEGSDIGRWLDQVGTYELVEEIELQRLDDILGDSMHALKGRVAVAKIDVEGFEPNAYAGGRQFFDIVRPQYLMAEINSEYHGLLAPLGLLKLYDELGYRIHVKSFHGKVLNPLAFEQIANQVFLPGTLANIYLTRRQGC